MPEVPRYTKPQVQEAPLSNAKMSVTLPQDNASKAWEQLSASATSTAEVLHKVKNQNDLVAGLDAQNKFQAKMNGFHVGKDSYLNLTGVEASTATPVYQDKAKQAYDEIYDRLANDDQRLFFKIYADKAKTDLMYKTEHHAHIEGEKFKQQVLETNIKYRTQDSINNWHDPDMVDSGIEDMDYMIDHHAAYFTDPEHPEMDKVAPETVDANGKVTSIGYKGLLKLQIKSAVYAGVANQIMLNRGGNAAKAYANDHKDQMTVEDYTRTMHMIEPRADKEEATSFVNSITSKPNWEDTGETEIMKRFKNDPEKRNYALTEFRIMKHEKKEQNNNVYSGSLGASIDAARAGKDPALTVPSQMWDVLSKQDQKDAQDIREKAINPDKFPANQQVLHDLTTKSIKELQKMSEAEMKKQWLYIDENDHVKFKQQWELAQEAKTNPKKAAQYHADQSDIRILFQVLREKKVAGMNFDTQLTGGGKYKMTDDQVRVKNAFQDAFANRLNTYSSEHGNKRPTAAEKMKIAVELVMERQKEVTVEHWYGNKKIMASDIKDEDRSSAIIPLKQIGTKEREDMMAEMLNNSLFPKGAIPQNIDVKTFKGFNPDTAASIQVRMQKAWAQKLMGNEQAYKDILSK
jgi:hypothetical protein